jgi:hypothetical protein
MFKTLLIRGKIYAKMLNLILDLSDGYETWWS